MTDMKKYAASETLIPIPEIPTPVMNHIYFLANSMIGKSNLVEADRCDIIQELSLAVLKARPRCKKSEKYPKGTAFFNHVADNAATDIYRWRICRRIDVQSVPLDDCLSAEEKETRDVFVPATDDFEQRMLCYDVREVVAEMPDDLQAICELLMDGHPVNTISCILGIPEPTIRMRRIPQISSFFREHGINP